MLKYLYRRFFAPRPMDDFDLVVEIIANEYVTKAGLTYGEITHDLRQLADHFANLSETLDP